MKTKCNRLGFTIIELIVAVAIILLLVAVLTISLQKVLESSRNTKHASNLRQLWSTVLLYSNDNQGFLPPNKSFGTGTWQHHLVRWHKGLSVTETSLLFFQYETSEQREPAGFLLLFNSPLNTTRGNMAFGSGGWPTGTSTSEVFGRPLVSIDNPATAIALLPYYSDTKTLRGGNWQRPGANVTDVSFDANGFATCAFVDGSVQTISRESILEGRFVYIYPSVAQPD